MGKANKYSCLKNYTSIVRNLTSMSGHKSYVLLCMHVLDACFEAMYMLMHDALFGITPIL